VVIGLALQDTLGNIFAGVALQLDAAIAIDDWVRIDDRVIGRVREVRWRSTSLETKDGDIIVFPNTVLNKAMVTRFNHGGLEHRQVIEFHADLRHPPNRVIDIVLDALKDTPNLSRSTPPECLLAAFDDSGVRYMVRYRLIDYQTDTRTDSEVRKRIWYAFQRHELDMPWPTRTHLLTQLTPEQGKEKIDRDLRRRLRALAKIAFFAPLNDEERQQLAEGLRFLPFASGELILRQGEPGDSLFVVRDGRVSVRLAIEGSAKEIAVLGAGDFFGEMSLLTGEPRRASVLAVEDTECYVVDRALFEGILQRNPRLAESISHLLAEREVDLQSQKHSLEASQRSTDRAALLDRIRRFFRLS
jgi:CRP-like cAMP-binding protein